MSALRKVLYRKHMADLAEESQARSVANGVFLAWRDRYVALLCAYLRLYKHAELNDCRLPKPWNSMDWCNAAVSIMTVAEDSIVDVFLRADRAMKNNMVRAVLDDGGLEDLNGHFHELPPL